MAGASGKESKVVHELKEWGKALAYAVIFGTIIRLFMFETMMVPTESMVPTIDPGDRLFVEKVTYQFKEPDYGDIVVFWAPFVDKSALEMLGPFDKFMDLFSPKEFKGHVKYVKRLVGKPGDTIELRVAPEYKGIEEELLSMPHDSQPHYQLYVNGKVLPEFENRRYSREAIFADKDFYLGLAHPDKVYSIYNEFFRYYQRYLDYASYYDSTLNPLDLRKYIWQDPKTKTVKITIPEGFYFFMGDNTKNSFDSRFFGFVPRENIVGQPMLRIWELSRFGPLKEKE
ncbi:signal peptidase I [Kosmotoga pacifica]|uniref:Signal peptidase I n=1 Tax=Kosmotoga pacifica TaxID=1330330 RepID=A0A0G2ZAJ4_9BACT|nr:signal peptidase I [Kosmotoga pacifica]AKI97116.1 signal peptidase [Kosmotoga pacifica]